METKIKYREGDLKYWDIKLTFSAVEYHYTVALISKMIADYVLSDVCYLYYLY